MKNVSAAADAHGSQATGAKKEQWSLTVPVTPDDWQKIEVLFVNREESFLQFRALVKPCKNHIPSHKFSPFTAAAYIIQQNGRLCDLTFNYITT